MRLKPDITKYTPKEQEISNGLCSKYLGERLVTEQKLRDMCPRCQL